MTTVYITKYALTTGISKHEASIADERAYPGKPFAGWVGFKIGMDAHLTEKAALATAEKMRAKQIASARKKITKLESLIFEVPK